MKIAVVGLAYSHPYTYTQILQRTGHTVTHVWDDVPERLKEFAEKFGVAPVSSPEEIPFGAVDGVIATSRLPERIDHAVMFLEKGIPAYTSKPAAVTLEQLQRITSAVRRFHKESLSEDAVVVALEWEDGLPGVIEVPCGVKGESFGAEVFGREAILKFAIPKGDVQEAGGAALGDVDPWVEFGYAGTMEAFIGMCRTRQMPVPLEETEKLAKVLIRARESASTGRPIDIGPY
jgi:predicted dehydrogenase